MGSCPGITHIQILLVLIYPISQNIEGDCKRYDECARITGQTSDFLISAAAAQTAYGNINIWPPKKEERKVEKKKKKTRIKELLYRVFHWLTTLCYSTQLSPLRKKEREGGERVRAHDYMELHTCFVQYLFKFSP